MCGPSRHCLYSADFCYVLVAVLNDTPRMRLFGHCPADPRCMGGACRLEAVASHRTDRAHRRTLTLHPYDLIARPVQISSHAFTMLERAYMDLTRRYPQLVVSGDFSKLVACWTQVRQPRHIRWLTQFCHWVCHTVSA